MAELNRNTTEEVKLQGAKDELELGDLAQELSEREMSQVSGGGQRKPARGQTHRKRPMGG